MRDNIVSFQDKLYEKFNVNLSEESYNRLADDAISFNVLKRDGKTPNLGKIFNLLISNYLSSYSVKIASIASSTLTLLKKDFPLVPKADLHDIAKAIAWKNNELYVTVQESQLTRKLPVRINENNRKTVVENLGPVINSNNISGHFRNLIDSYLSLPAYIREQILYKDAFDQLQKAISDGVQITYRNKARSKVIKCSPFKTYISKHEWHNYLICQNEYGFINSIKLCSLSDVIVLRDKVVFRDDFIDRLAEMEHNGIQFGIDKKTTTTVLLNNNAFDSYNKNYVDRPDYTEIKYSQDGSVELTFNCSAFQLNKYFFPFSSEINNKEIKAVLIDQYIG